jgi:hypothetical protein
VDEIENQIKMGNSGHFAECLHSAKSEESLPSVCTRQNLRIFAECLHSAKKLSLPSARSLALGKDDFFAECQGPGTRQSVRYVPAPSRRLNFAECGTLRSAKVLPSARRNALGKVSFADIFSSVCPLPSATLGKGFAEYF